MTDRLPSGEARAEDRGLREVRALVDPRERIGPDEQLNALEQIWPLFGDRVAHLRGLASLSGEQNGCGGHSHHRTHAGGSGYSWDGAFPPNGGNTAAERRQLRFRFAAMSLPEPRPNSAALVTGASAGIGAEIARELAARGHNLVLVARRKDRLDELAQDLEADHGIRAETVSCDLGKATTRKKLPAQVKPFALDVEILVNNAGFATNGAFHKSDPERELEQVRLLVEAPVALTSMFAPDMVRRSRGGILNISSTAGMQPLPYSAGYSAAKAYLLTFSEALHQELRGHGITVTVMCPGPVSTEFWEISGWQVQGGQTFESAVPRPAWITPQQAAKEGVRGLEHGTRVVVPGFQVRAAMQAVRYLPHAVKLPAIEWLMRGR